MVGSDEMSFYNDPFLGDMRHARFLGMLLKELGQDDGTNIALQFAEHNYIIGIEAG